MILIVIFVAFGISTLDSLPTNRDGCIVSLKQDLSNPQPLVLVKKGLEVSYVEPNDAGTLSFRPNEEFRLACVGRGNYFVGMKDDDEIQDVAVFCLGEKTFLVNSSPYEFRDLKCKSQVLSVVRKTGETCLENYTKIEIGFDLGKEFLRTLEICRDDAAYRTIYAKFNLTKAIGGFQKGYRRPSWRQANFWSPYNVNRQYKRSVQRNTVSKILGSKELGLKYIGDKSDSYFSRGHLAAKSDFVYGTAQSSTFWYINTFPQWQAFNGGNWNLLENGVRDYARFQNIDLHVYTGTHDVLTLKDVDKVDQPMYLYASGDIRALEIPLYFWKIVYDPSSKKGTAFVGLNNPFVANSTEARYRICEDISGGIPWVKWQREKGMSYACRIEDLGNAVPTLPVLDVVGLLA